MNKQPLITNGFILRMSIGIALLLCATILIYYLGGAYGERMSLGGHSNDQNHRQIIIGGETLAIKANKIRFDKQRRDGVADGISLYVSWPEFEGYQPDNKQKFNQTGNQSELIFINIANAVAGADMSARYNSIYKNFTHGAAETGPGGLLRYQMNPQSSFKDEILFTEPIIKERPFVILCLNAKGTDIPNAANCQRDIQFKDKFLITYRYSEDMLPDWQMIEAKLMSYISSILSAPSQ